MSTFKSYKNDAWEDPEINRRYEADAWTDCEFAKRYISDAWEEVWTAVKWMKALSDTLPSGVTAGHVKGAPSDKDGWAIWFFEGDNDSGSATYYLDGEFTNPTISFDYDGFFSFTPNGQLTYASSGKLELYTRTTSGTESYTTAVGSIQVVEGTENYSTTLSGTFDRVGIRFTFTNWTVDASMSPQYLLNLWNILIDGKFCLPGDDCVHV